MKVEVRTSGPAGTSRSPRSVFRKWVIIGAVVGAALVGIAGAIVLGLVMIGGAFVGAGFGAIFGVFKALMALIGRG